ncbi:MAG TPA: tetratricopeptide repeat protein [Rhizomicrobium sp.]|nr:tetratricopeptide repeat protein [Rhizomicrobium sp.]
MSDLQESLQRARQAYEGGDLALCRQFLDQAAAVDPESLGLLRWRARLAHREGDWPVLQDAAQRYCEVDPDDREMRQFHARACSNLKLWNEATEAWQQLIVLRPEWPEAYFQLARSQIRSNFASAASATIAKLEALGDKDRTAWQLGGRLAVEAGDIARAIRMFSRLTEHDAARVEDELRLFEKAKDYRGMLAAATAMRAHAPSQEWDGKIAAVMAELTKSAALHQRDGDLVDAYHEFAAIAAASNDDRLATSGMDRIMLTLRNQAKRFVAQEEPRKAIHAYQTILRCEPGNDRALVGMGRLLMALQDWPSAMGAWSAVLDKSPRDRDALVQYARAAERAQDFPHAYEAWSRVLAEAPGDLEAEDAIAKLPARAIRAGRKAVDEKQLVEAARLFATVPENRPEYADARRRLDQVARYLVRDMRAAYKEKKFAQVVSLGTTASKIAPESIDVHRLLAQAAMTSRDYAVAAHAWKRLAVLVPEDSGGHALQIARCYLRMGRTEDGQAILSDLIQREPENEAAKALAAQFAARGEATTFMGLGMDGPADGGLR